MTGVTSSRARGASNMADVNIKSSSERVLHLTKSQFTKCNISLCHITTFLLSCLIFISILFLVDIRQTSSDKLIRNLSNRTLIRIDYNKTRQLRPVLNIIDSCPENLIQSLPYPPVPPVIPIFKTVSYAASFPGSGDKLFSKYLVEFISGVEVGEAAVSPSLHRLNSDGTTFEHSGGQGTVIALRTHFPHTSGKLASWDTFIKRSFVILRNPLHAIPSYFNEVYEIRNHLPSGTSKDKQHAKDTYDAWIKWRDNQLDSQILLYRRFVSFWMERHFDDDANRIIFTFEDFVDEITGPDEAIRLAKFIEDGLKRNVREMVQSGAMPVANANDTAVIDELLYVATKHMVNASYVPCLWKEVVYPTSNRRLQEHDASYSSSSGGQWSSDTRPLTPANIASIGQMLLELMNRWSRHQRLLNIIAGYHREVNDVYLKVTDQFNAEKSLNTVQTEVQEKVSQDGSHLRDESSHSSQKQPFAKRFHIIQASPPRTASTVATNWLIGLFEPDSDFAFMSNWPVEPIRQGGKDTNIESHTVTKTHDMDILRIYNAMRPLFDEIFFVVSFRESDSMTQVDAELCELKNVLCIQYEELIFTNKKELIKMVQELTKKLKSRFEYFFGPNWISKENETSSFTRLEAMAMAKTELSNKPYDVMDMKFGVHGGQKGDDGGRNQNRRLSAVLSERGCQISLPQPAEVDVEKSYAAAFPGCGAQMTWKLIEGITGLWTGDDRNSNNRDKHVIAVNTLYPHDAGKLVQWDNEIKRAIVVIRNPMDAFRSMFSHAYETKNHLPVHSQQIPIDAWLAWRDSMVPIQITKFSEFIDYWMKRFKSKNSDRIFISYEKLVDDATGPEEAIRLNNFLSKCKGVSALLKESVPCVWEAIVKFDYDGKNSKHFHGSYLQNSRPYTTELLQSMSQMLLDLIQKWGESHLRLRTILEVYNEQINLEPTTPRLHYISTTSQIRLSENIPLSSQVGEVSELSTQQTSNINFDELQKVNGKSFHIFQASPPHTGSTVLNNWLMGLFEPDADYSFMVNNLERSVRQHDKDVPIDATLVTKTHILDLISLYKQFRPQFDEVFFVVSYRSNSQETRIDPSLCEYSNVMCVECEELLFTNRREIESMVFALTDRFQAKFEYFFGQNSSFLQVDKQMNAVRRLEKMTEAEAALSNQPFLISDHKYGVHVGHASRVDGVVQLQEQGSELVTIDSNTFINRRLFYCGGAIGLERQHLHYSIFGLFLAHSVFPDVEGKVELRPNQELINTAIPLTEETLGIATDGDILIVHSHQFCQVPVKAFPGPQLHINAEYYDLHPDHQLNINGKYTLNYLPESKKSIIIGPHEDTDRSLRVPYCSMRLWFLHKTRDSFMLEKIIDPKKKPMNTRSFFLLYVNSHYIDYRERSARALSEIGTIHVAGQCQGNFESGPALNNDRKTKQCQPFDDDKRPSSIVPITNTLSRDEQGYNAEMFSRYRFALVMENANVAGYISEKILDAFLSGSVPIYYGNQFVFEIFNPKAFVFFDVDNPNPALMQIQFMEQNPEQYDRMINEPILANGNNTIEQYFSWDESVGNGVLKSRIRQLMGLKE